MKSLRKKARHHRLSEEFQALEAEKVLNIYSHLSHDSDSHNGSLKSGNPKSEELYWQYGERNAITAGDHEILQSVFNVLSVDEQIENIRRQLYPSVRSSPEIKKASLDCLPVELKILILKEIPNIPTLRSLTLACPNFYDVYVDQRTQILSPLLTRCLAQGLDIAACALLEVSRMKPGAAELRKFIISYEVDRALCFPFRVEDGEDLAQIARDYLLIYDSTAQFVQEAISRRPMTGERAAGTWGDFASLSRTEKRRFYRGFYNYEIICRLVRDVAGSVSGHDYQTAEAALRIFKPWEMEEINCARYYVQKCYIDIVKRCSTVLGIVFGQTNLIDGRVILRAPCQSYIHRTGKYKSQSTRSNKFNMLIYGILESEWYRDAAEVLMTKGLHFLRAVLTAPSPDHQISILQPVLATSAPPSKLTQKLWSTLYKSNLRSGLVGYIDFNPTHHRRRTRLRQHHHPELRFRGEHKGPNAALVWADSLATNLPVQWPEKERQLAWAYVMWDRDRLQDWNVLGTGFRYMADIFGEGGDEKLVLYGGVKITEL